MPPNFDCICRTIRVWGPYAHAKMRYGTVVPRTPLCNEAGLCDSIIFDALMSDPKSDRPHLDHIEDFSTDLFADS